MEISSESSQAPPTPSVISETPPLKKKRWLLWIAVILAAVLLGLPANKAIQKKRYISDLKKGTVGPDLNFPSRLFFPTGKEARNAYMSAVEKGQWGGETLGKLWDDCAAYIADHPGDAAALAALGEGLNMRGYSEELAGRPANIDGQMMIANAVTKNLMDLEARMTVIRWWVQPIQDREKFIAFTENLLGEDQDPRLMEEHLFTVFLYAPHEMGGDVLETLRANPDPGPENLGHQVEILEWQGNTLEAEGVIQKMTTLFPENPKVKVDLKNLRARLEKVNSGQKLENNDYFIPPAHAIKFVGVHASPADLQKAHTSFMSVPQTVKGIKALAISKLVSEMEKEMPKQVLPSDVVTYPNNPPPYSREVVQTKLDALFAHPKILSPPPVILPLTKPDGTCTPFGTFLSELAVLRMVLSPESRYQYVNVLHWFFQSGFFRKDRKLTREDLHFLQGRFHSKDWVKGTLSPAGPNWKISLEYELNGKKGKAAKLFPAAQACYIPDWIAGMAERKWNPYLANGKLRKKSKPIISNEALARFSDREGALYSWPDYFYGLEDELEKDPDSPYLNYRYITLASTKGWENIERSGAIAERFKDSPAFRYEVGKSAKEYNSFNIALDHLVQAMQKDTYNCEYALVLCGVLQKMGYWVLADGVYRRLIDADPQVSDLYTMFGRFNVDYAWEARGSDWAKNVPRWAWPLFSRRLKRSELLYGEAAKLDPQDPRPWINQLISAKGLSYEMEKTQKIFETARKLHPNYATTYIYMIGYLDPKWGGEFETQLKFARDHADIRSCFVMDVIMDRYMALNDDEVQGKVTGESECPMNRGIEYLQTPEVWGELRAAYLKQLEMEPCSVAWTKDYANLTVWSDQSDAECRYLWKWAQTHPGARSAVFKTILRINHVYLGAKEFPKPERAELRKKVFDSAWGHLSKAYEALLELEPSNELRSVYARSALERNQVDLARKILGKVGDKRSAFCWDQANFEGARKRTGLIPR